MQDMGAAVFLSLPAIVLLAPAAKCCQAQIGSWQLLITLNMAHVHWQLGAAVPSTVSDAATVTQMSRVTRKQCFAVLS
jgi:hypothetical protein